MKLIERDFYLDKLKNVMGTPDIKVMTGVRRCGKSKLMDAFIDWIKQNEKDSNIIHINYNLFEYDSIKTAYALDSYVEERYQSNKTNFLLIDEVQLCSDFEKVLNKFYFYATTLLTYSEPVLPLAVWKTASKKMKKAFSTTSRMNRAKSTLQVFSSRNRLRIRMHLLLLQKTKSSRRQISRIIPW
ncbi:MAG: AAA family ATPase [Candidatus Treponema excrementipullorum]|nr:AAA family ATPase [Candidatus Treponema excrementipullorum]